jgi:hypothetical protein
LTSANLTVKKINYKAQDFQISKKEVLKKSGLKSIKKILKEKLNEKKFNLCVDSGCYGSG